MPDTRPPTSLAQLAFALTLVVCSAVGLWTGHAGAIWGPIPHDVWVRAAPILGANLFGLGTGIALMRRATTAGAAGALLAASALWLVTIRAAWVLSAPAVAGYWSGCGETAVLTAAAWALRAQATPDARPGARRWFAGRDSLRAARLLYGLALIPFGVAHFVYATETASLVPAWLPAHDAIALATGGAYLAAAVALLTGVLAPLAAALVALQMALFTALVWVPIVVTGRADASAWSETLLSFALSAAGWVLARSCRDTGSTR